MPMPCCCGTTSYYQATSCATGGTANIWSLGAPLLAGLTNGYITALGTSSCFTYTDLTPHPSAGGTVYTPADVTVFGDCLCPDVLWYQFSWQVNCDEEAWDFVSGPNEPDMGDNITCEALDAHVDGQRIFDGRFNTVYLKGAYCDATIPDNPGAPAWPPVPNVCLVPGNCGTDGISSFGNVTVPASSALATFSSVPAGNWRLVYVSGFYIYNNPTVPTSGFLLAYQPDGDSIFITMTAPFTVTGGTLGAPFLAQDATPYSDSASVETAYNTASLCFTLDDMADINIFLNPGSPFSLLNYTDGSPSPTFQLQAQP